MSKHLKEIKQSVSFIFIKNNENKFIANGTGFFIGLETKEKKGEHAVFFATAKHVLKDQRGDYFEKVAVRLNKKDGTSDLIEIDLSKINIMEHEDISVDIAIFPFLPNQEIYDFKFIPEKLFATEEKMEKNDISEGDEVFFTGLFTSHIGQKKNQPIIRFGRVALISDEKIEWKNPEGKVDQVDMYLLECQSYGGNSGSPVFFQLNPMRVPGQIRMGGVNIFLAGIMSGSFLSGNHIHVTASKASNLVSMQNIGIAAVTPATKLIEILHTIKNKSI